ncbi:hypothetical protein BH23ACT9_BH23ACT9_28230 [soil metagenome]
MTTTAACTSVPPAATNAGRRERRRLLLSGLARGLVSAVALLLVAVVVGMMWSLTTDGSSLADASSRALLLLSSAVGATVEVGVLRRVPDYASSGVSLMTFTWLVAIVIGTAGGRRSLPPPAAARRAVGLGIGLAVGLSAALLVAREGQPLLWDDRSATATVQLVPAATRAFAIAALVAVVWTSRTVLGRSDVRAVLGGMATGAQAVGLALVAAVPLAVLRLVLELDQQVRAAWLATAGWTAIDIGAIAVLRGIGAGPSLSIGTGRGGTATRAAADLDVTGVLIGAAWVAIAVVVALHSRRRLDAAHGAVSLQVAGTVLGVAAAAVVLALLAPFSFTVLGIADSGPSLSGTAAAGAVDALTAGLVLGTAGAVAPLLLRLLVAAASTGPRRQGQP